MKRYNPKEIEPKWQQKWQESQIYKASEDSTKPKRYVLEYFPYPSGAAMHVGHVRNYTIGDAIARFRRMQGDNVLYPMGWDSFGLPAERYAIKNNISPKQAIAENTAKFKQQLTQMGFSYDWSREIDSSKPEYYKWTQWFFKLLFERGLAYQKDSLQWWCETDKTVLANEQVEAGKCWRCGDTVTKKSLKQWFFKITDYADRLVDDLEKLDWSDSIKSMQKNWIGKSRGAEIDFKLADSVTSSEEDGTIQNSQDAEKDIIRVFTTRPDTLFGATFVVLAPEHDLVQKISTEEQRDEVDSYVKKSQAKSDIERQETNREKTGVFTGAYAINPVNDEKIPIWIADYVLTGYGTGAIMAVPAHDERDYDFAKKFELPINEVIAPVFGMPLPDSVDVTGPVVIGYDPRIQQYMSLINNKNGMRWFAAGGLEDGETYEEAALRELKEEAGFSKVEKLIQLGGPNYSFFHNPNKNSNRRSFSYMYLAIIDKNSVGEQQLESHEQYEVEWSGIDEIRKDLEREPSGRDHWLDGLERTKAAVEAYENDREYHGPIISREGILFNSGGYNGLNSEEAREKITTDLALKGVAEEKVNYKIRDWLISRQRYWGAPIPIIHCEVDGVVPVPDDQLPVVLPELTNFQPTGKGSALAGAEEWINTTCPKCGGPAKRETDTMDGFACSSWYFLRFADPHNTDEPFSKEKANFWLPVDDYIGGAEHAVMHLLYARMWTKVMFDAGLIEFDEPFKALRNQGMILAPDGRKMSKSWGNVISPDEIIEQGYGADAIRLMELFIGPWNQEAAWSVEGMGGCFRFLQRLWTLVQEFVESEDEGNQQKELLATTNKTVKKVTEDMLSMGFNTAIAALMAMTNELYKIKAEQGFTDRENWSTALQTIVQLLAPFAPHITEELWIDLGQPSSVHSTEWPTWDEKFLTSDTVRIVVQVNGKVRTILEVDADSSEEIVVNAAKANEKVAANLGDNFIKKTIYVPNKIVNFVI